MVFAETGLLVGFILPGDTLLIITGLLAFPPSDDRPPVVNIPIWIVCISIAFAAFLGGESGYLIGRKAGPRIFERFGGLAVIVARFVPVVRTFAPVAAGVGKMDPRKYSLFNAAGALLWGGGLTFGGYLLGNIPVVAAFVTKYIDIILLGAMMIAIVPTIYHYISSVIKARKNRNLELPTDEQVALDAAVFERRKKA